MTTRKFESGYSKLKKKQKSWILCWITKRLWINL